MADYENKVHNLYASFNYAASKKLNIFGTLTFNKSESSLQEVIMPVLPLEITEALENQDFDYTNLPTYSDFDYQLINFKLGFGYKFTKDLSFNVDGQYADLTDDLGYVYGNETGSYFVIRSGIKINF